MKMNYNEEDMKILKRAYIDYKQLERKLSIDIGDTDNIKKVYDYILELKRNDDTIGMTNVDLDICEYFDFNYKDMCLTISKNNYRNVCRLAESIELWNDNKTTYINTIDFEELEKLVLGYEK